MIDKMGGGWGRVVRMGVGTRVLRLGWLLELGVEYSYKLRGKGRCLGWGSGMERGIDGIGSC